MSVLFPEGIRSLADMPYQLHDAISVGLQFLRFTEMEKDESPPRKIWLDQDALAKHFNAVEKRRKEKWDTDSKGKPKGEIEDPVRNDAARILLGDLEN